MTRKPTGRQVGDKKAGSGRANSGFVTDNLTAIAGLRAARRAAQDAEIELRRRGEVALAEAAWERAQQLTIQIDILIGRLMERWGNQTKGLTRTLDTARASLEEGVGRLRKAAHVADEVAGVLEGLERAIAVGARLLL